MYCSTLGAVMTLCVVLGAGAGCSGKRGKKTSGPSASSSMGGVKPAKGTPLDETHKWDCRVDADCQNSCSQGAVSRAWYKKNQGRILECVDGCDNQISGPPRCESKQCVAYDNKGMRRSYCTRKPARRQR